MALIGEIRQRSWILIVFIGLGMAGFLLMDAIQNGSNLFGNSTTIGKIAGRKISVIEFQNKQQEIYGNSSADPYQIREGVWQNYIREAIINAEAEALGLRVSDEEFNELAFGPNPETVSPIMRQYFGDRQTGQIDMNRLQSLRQQVEGNQLKAEDLASWNTLKSQIIMDKLNDKINTIVKKSVYTPTWMAKMAHNDQNLKINFNFVGVPYASVNDSEVKVTESELNAYIKENAGKFKVDEENRKFDYVLFNVAATQKDSADIATRLKEQMPILVESKDDSLLFATTPGSIYEEKYVEKTQLAPQIADTVSSISVGTVFGPYVDGSKYKVAKLVDKMILADSVKARHLLRGVSQNQEQTTYYEQMGKEIALVDSLIKELEKGTANFDSLTRKYSTDNSNKDKGGDLGVFGPGQMVAKFNDLVFFKSETGKYYKVITQFGVHIVQVQNKYQSGKTGYKVGYIQESIIPSQDTEKDILRKASKFAASIKSLKELTDKAKKAGLEVQSTPIGAKRNDYDIAGVGQGDAAREIIKWGYDADAGDASNEVYRFESTGEDIYVEKFAVVGLRSVAKKGLATLADEAVRLQAETAVKNRKKAEIIKKKIDKGQSLDAIAAAFKSQVQVASQVSFNTPNVEGMGTEPKVVAAAFKQKVNKVSEPIAGNTAVFVVELTFKPEPTEPTDLPIAKEQAAASMRSQVDFALFQALRKQTPVEDYRYRFF